MVQLNPVAAVTVAIRAPRRQRAAANRKRRTSLDTVGLIQGIRRFRNSALNIDAVNIGNLSTMVAGTVQTS